MGIIREKDRTRTFTHSVTRVHLNMKLIKYVNLVVLLVVKLIDQYLKLQNLVKEAIVGIILMMVIV